MVVTKQRRYKPNESIRKARGDHGFSRKELGELLEVSYNNVFIFEVGMSRAPLEIREKMSNLFGGTEKDYRSIPTEIQVIRDSAKDKNINHILRNAIYDNGLTPAEINDIRGTSKTTINHYIHRNNSFGIVKRELAEELASIIGCSPEKIQTPEWEVYLLKNPNDQPNLSLPDENLESVLSDDLELKTWRDNEREDYNFGIVHDALGRLSPEERSLIERIYGINRPQMTSAEIGKYVGKSRELVRQRGIAALKKLKTLNKKKKCLKKLKTKNLLSHSYLKKIMHTYTMYYLEEYTDTHWSTILM